MIEFYNEDCMAVMARYPDKYFELSIVDPPYGIGLPICQTGRWKRKIHEKKDWDNKSPDKDYFESLIRVSKNQIIWGANHFISKIPFDSSCWIFWDKKNGDNFMSDGEMAYTSFTTKVRRFTYNHIQEHNAGIPRIHPSQKPIALYQWLLKNYARPGDKILDTHGGSMSIAIACYYAGHDLVICEMDKDYFEAGKARVERETKFGFNLFASTEIKKNEGMGFL